MTSVQTELPDSLYRVARELAEKEGIPVDRLLGLAMAQAIGSWASQDDLIKQRASRGNRERFLEVLAKVPDAPPVSADELAG